MATRGGYVLPDPDRQVGARLRVLLPARLLWDKGLAEGVQAARLLHGEGRPIDFLLAGDLDPGNPAAVPWADVCEWVGQGLVQWLGHVDDMPALLRSVDVVALPSYREGLPKGLIEAAASGCALVTTDVPGCREVVTHEVDGLLFGKTLLHVQSPCFGELDSRSPRYSKPGGVGRIRRCACAWPKQVAARHWSSLMSGSSSRKRWLYTRK